MLPTIKESVKKTIVYGLSWCFGISLLVTLIITFFLDTAPSVSDFFYSLTISVVYSFSYWGGTVYLVYFLNKKYDWLRESRKRIVSGVIGTLVISFGFAFVINFFLLVVFGKYPFKVLFTWSVFKIYLFPAIVNIIISLWFHLQSFFVKWKEVALKEERLKSENALAKLEALQQQLDPHFLFNTFNVLTELIEEDSKLAQKFVGQLSKVYRYVLEMRSKTLVPLNEELNFAKSYLFLLKIRFDDGFHFSMNIPENGKEFSIVPVSIQLLIENAIKHNSVSKLKPLELSIFVENQFLCIKNNLSPKAIVPASSTGIGLDNIVSRYKLLNPELEPLIVKTDDYFMVKIPLLNE